MRRLAMMVVTTILIGVVIVLGWGAVTHRLGYVITNGVSMQPLYHADDLVATSKRDSYGVGDIVAYKDGPTTVLHRIIHGDAGGWITQGDNNDSVDPLRPTSAQIIGRAFLHIPKGGTWLKRALSTPVLAALAFFVLFGTEQTVRRRRRRRRRRRKVVDKPVVSGGSAGIAAALSSPRLRLIAGLIAAVGLFAILLAGLIGIKSPTIAVAVQPPAGRSMTFSYGTTVPLSNAYDGTEVTAPDPVFRSVADTVDVTYAYRGPPGQVKVDAELSISNGWHSTVPLIGMRPTDGTGSLAVVRLDLDALAARAAAGAKATGGPGSAVAISVVPRITNATGEPFAPALKLKLSPTTLTSETAESSVTVQDAAPPKINVAVPRVLSLAGRSLISVPTSRVLSAALLLAALLGAAALMAYIRRIPAPPEGELIRRQHSSLLIEVEPVVAPTDRPVVEVTEFNTLVRLAQRYGLLILHWTIDEQTTFTVHDDATAYLYHTAAPEPEPIEKFDAPNDDQPEDAHWRGSLAGANDGLTKLANRSLFEREVQHAIEKGDNLCLMLIDVDNLDSINEEHGREAGDAVLVKTAERLRRAVRPGDLVARLTGDDFAVLFEGVGHDAVDSVANRILGMTHEAMLVDDQPLQVQVRLGLAPADSGQDAALLMEQATAALATAKAADTMHYSWYVQDPAPQA